jgi:uncharacterized repeat protein (TIGR03803 family)
MRTVGWKYDFVDWGEGLAGEWTEDPGAAGVPGLDPVGPERVRADFGVGSYDSATKSPKFTLLVEFASADGAHPEGALIADAAGDLLGTTSAGGADNDGAVFEIAKTRRGYAAAPTTLVSFTDADGNSPDGSLLADAAGDLFGTTFLGGAGGLGTVFEIAKTRRGYAAAPTTLVNFTNDHGANADGENPNGGLIADAEGNLFGTTENGGSYEGTVFEIAKTKSGYASAPTYLVKFAFGGADGSQPSGSLIADAAGNLFGTTVLGGADNDGVVFEIAKTRNGYAGAPTTLVSFTGADGAGPLGGLIADAAGDLFGTTQAGGAQDDGAVFEIAKTKTGYANAPTVLVSFDGADGLYPCGDLIADAAGDLFGATAVGGTYGNGTVFEIAKIKSGYASAPTVLVNLSAADGNPIGSLMADASGDLFGATVNGADQNDGAVFEITNSGFAPFAAASTPDAPAALAASSGAAATFVHAMASHGSSRPGSGGPEILAWRNDAPMLLSRPHAAF